MKKNKKTVIKPLNKGQLLIFLCSGSFQNFFYAENYFPFYKTRIIHFSPYGDWVFCFVLFDSAYHEYFSFFDKCSF